MKLLNAIAEVVRVALGIAATENSDDLPFQVVLLCTWRVGDLATGYFKDL